MLTYCLLIELLQGESLYLYPNITTGSGTRKQGAVHPSQRPQKLFWQPILNLPTLSHVYLPTESTVKAFVHTFPCSLCLLTKPSTCPCDVLGLLCILSLGICEFNPLLLWQLFPCLCVLPYSIKMYPGYTLTHIFTIYLAFKNSTIVSIIGIIRSCITRYNHKNLSEEVCGCGF